MATVGLSSEKNQSALEMIERIRRENNVKQMLQRPFFSHIEQTRMSREQLREFFLQYFSIVQTSWRMLAVGIATTPQAELDVVMHLVRFLETEAGGAPNHAGYYFRWAEAFGVSAEELLAVQPNNKSRAFEETLMGYFQTSDSLTKQAAQFGTEDCAEVLIDGLHKGFQWFPMNARAYGYLAIHRLLENDEEGHSRWAIDGLAKNPQLHARRDEIEGIYRSVYRAFTGVFDGIYEAWKLPSAAA
jgi:pyrroloquinoline quinone (PQQ) biosynthesis protein C